MAANTNNQQQTQPQARPIALQQTSHGLLSIIRFNLSKMKEMLHLLWQKIKQHPFIAVGILVALLAIIALMFAVLVFGWDWTGLAGGESKITITSTSKGVTTTKELQPGKTLWDWLGLLAVLAIPVVAGIAAAWFNAQLGRANDRRNNLEQMKNQQIIANQFQQTLLQEYQDRMSELLISQDLRNSLEYSEVRKIARARTLATLVALDGIHKGILLQFLSESGLIEKNRSIIDLRHADLSSTNLHGAVLQTINLAGANLSHADLSKAYLSHADLSGANLEEANLENANLSKADLYQTNLTKANLSGAKLKDALLEAAGLGDANLENADLRDANLEIAWLIGANLRGANLRGAYLNNAMFEDEEAYVDAHSRAGATMPDGSRHQ